MLVYSQLYKLFHNKEGICYTFAFPLAQMQLSSDYKPSLHLKKCLLCIHVFVPKTNYYFIP